MGAISNNYINLDLSIPRLQNVRCVKGDIDSRVINITVTDRGQVYNLSNVDIYFRMKKPDGKNIFWKNGTDSKIVVSNNKVVITLDANCTAVSGVCQSELQIVDNVSKTVISTMLFNVIVENSAISDEEIESTDDYQALNELILHVGEVDTQAQEYRDETKVMRDEVATNTEIVENAVTEVNEKYLAAKSSAENAKVSETNAKTSEQNAKASETASKTSETNAKTSETNASQSASSASTSASNASQSATSASASASTATTKANEAVASASNASESEENAKTYATNASQSATSASASASTATTKANEASTSANNANTSEVNAKISEANAATSASKAKTSETNASTSASTASAKASEASTSASSASTSEVNASNSAILSESWAVGGTSSRFGEDTNNSKYYSTQASSSATNAKTSETNASNSATVATEKANAASVSATNAEESANNAKTYMDSTEGFKNEASASASSASQNAINADESATNASQSEINAAKSEANASTSEANSKTSETNAKKSETNAKTSETNAKTSETKAKEYMDDVHMYKLESQSWAIGGTNSRSGEDTDNSKYYSSQSATSASEAKKYYEQSKAISESLSGALRPMGTCTFSELPSLSSASEGDMYNISDEFITTSDFKEGSGLTIPAGSNIYKTFDNKWDVLAGSPVTGVKGDNETSYRRGNVNITKANIGLGNVPNVMTNDQTPTYTEATTLTKLTSGEKLSVAFGKIAKAISDLITQDNKITEISSILGVEVNEYDSTKDYDHGSIVVYDGKLYKNNIAIGSSTSPTKGEFDPDVWKEINAIEFWDKLQRAENISAGFQVNYSDSEDSLLGGSCDNVYSALLSVYNKTKELNNKSTYWNTAYTHSQSAHAPSGAQANIIETVKVNGTALTPSSKAVDITVPTKVSQLTNDNNYVTTSDSRLTNAREPYFANAKFYNVGDDVAIGDHNVAGSLCVKGLNGAPNIRLYDSSENVVGDVIHTGNIGSQSVNYANSAGSANSSGTSGYANTSHGLRSFSAGGGSHGESYVMYCKHNVDGDGRFKLYMNEGNEIKVHYATACDSAVWASNVLGTVAIQTGGGVQVQIAAGSSHTFQFTSPNTNVAYSSYLLNVKIIGSSGNVNICSINGTEYTCRIYNNSGGTRTMTATPLWLLVRKG